ncbi:NUDIX hydrolase [Streptomyces sp. YIM 98790]|uniref:NUDIX hydrolase n=1 Tax=Streptomyces sp. YIM 98790 TaxID=2689077 RepID=UPI001A9D7367|nr:NUDIX hydrolase [Streptomyces sp. YIM 98790]
MTEPLTGTAGALHRDADRVLAAWSPSDAEQEALRTAYRSHLAAHPDGMWRECRAGHLTASALVIDPARERVLLTLHGKLRMWLQMGGHCERPDTMLASVALREATEESGIAGLRLLSGGPVALDRHRTPCAWHLDVQYAALAPADAVERISEESLELRWFGYREAGEIADGSVRRLIARTRARL